MVPSPEGWGDMDGMWKPVWTLPEVAKGCLELLKCGANKNVLADANASKLTSLVQGYVSVQENAAIMNINLILIECVSNSLLPASFQSFLDTPP